jgi:hypothetical protein
MLRVYQQDVPSRGRVFSDPGKVLESGADFCYQALGRERISRPPNMSHGTHNNEHSRARQRAREVREFKRQEQAVLEERELNRRRAAHERSRKARGETGPAKERPERCSVCKKVFMCDYEAVKPFVCPGCRWDRVSRQLRQLASRL